MIETASAGLLLAREALLGPAAAHSFPADDPVSPFDLYLSPHFDDICFSLGALAASRRAGTLVTFCTQSRYVAVETGLPPDPDARVRHVSALRRSEDERFARTSGLRPVCLGLPEARLRGRAPFETAAAAQDWPLFARALASIPPLRPSGVRPWLFCPIAVGGHVDHVALRLAVLANLPKLASDYRIAFYEDLHYASHRWPRARAIAELRRAATGATLARYVVRVTAEKLELIAAYASQFERRPDSLKRFTPAAPRSPGAHEAIWTSESL